MKKRAFPAKKQFVEEAVVDLLGSLGFRPYEDGHMKETPKRVAKMFMELTEGYEDPKFNFTTFPRGRNDQMIVQSGIPVFSLCSHHLLPFFGLAHVAYVPGKRLVGLSKLARVVKHFSRRFQVQEDLTQQIADYIQKKLKPQGVGVVLECTHLCMAMRGVEKPHVTTTSALSGVFRKKEEVRAEFLNLVRRDGSRGSL